MSRVRPSWKCLRFHKNFCRRENKDYDKNNNKRDSTGERLGEVIYRRLATASSPKHTSSRKKTLTSILCTSSKPNKKKKTMTNASSSLCTSSNKTRKKKHWPKHHHHYALHRTEATQQKLQPLRYSQQGHSAATTTKGTGTTAGEFTPPSAKRTSANNPVNFWPKLIQEIHSLAINPDPS